METGRNNRGGNRGDLGMSGPGRGKEAFCDSVILAGGGGAFWRKGRPLKVLGEH